MQDKTPRGGPDGETALLHVFPSFSYGGQQARLAALARGLGGSFRHAIVALDGDVSARALFADDSVATFNALRLAKSSGFSLSNILRLARLIRDAKPDILCTYNWGAIEAAVANRFFACVPHVHFEDGFGPEESAERQLPRRVTARRLLLKNADVVVPSQTLEEIATEQWRLRRVTRIANGVDFERLQAGARGLRDAIIVGSVGALRPEKNYRRLIAAFFGADREKRARLEIVGGGPDLAGLRAAAGEDPRIALPGPTAAPADAYARFDIFALSSDTEQAPISLMEAMAAGLPVVATDTGDVAEMVAVENRSYIVPVGDEEAYMHALAQMLQNPSARAEIGAANRRKAKEAFSQDRMVAAYRALFEAVRGRRHG
jgi:L-malate glycosyltransferase